MPDRSGADASLPTTVSELWDLILTYAKQETIAPLKGIGRSLAFGVGGSLALSLGVVLLALSLLRVLQSETGSTFDGGWSWVPYVLTLVGVGSVAAGALLATRKRSADSAGGRR